jgi:hypothetical protein
MCDLKQQLIPGVTNQGGVFLKAQAGGTKRSG